MSDAFDRLDNLLVDPQFQKARSYLFNRINAVINPLLCYLRRQEQRADRTERWVSVYLGKLERRIELLEEAVGNAETCE